MKKKILNLLVRWGIPLGFLIVFVCFVVWVNMANKTTLINTTGQTFEKGIVTQIISDNLTENGTRVGEQKVKVKMTTGEKKGEEFETTSSSGFLFGAACKVGMRVIVIQSVAGDSVVTTIYSQDREYVIYIFAGLYLLALIVIGGIQGLKGAIGLIFTFFAMIFVEVPMVYRGYSAIGTAIFLCFITTLVTMYLIGGATMKTLVATFGSVTGVVLAFSCAKLFSLSSGITGWNVSNIENLLTLWNSNGIQVGDLLFSGILISSLGAVMDVAMSAASAMSEVVRQNPTISRHELFKSGMRVGRDMMGTDSNTLILAFAGGSLAELLLDYAYALPYRQIINSNNIGIAIMQGLGGSFGVVLSVPVTVFIGSLLLSKD
ncbi:MAG: YibE/F family protein [Catonella sp.]|nr:YibE/F family protein [Catonella sp.]MDY6357383.1 YibE/F family protein [Catonella sp.]